MELTTAKREVTTSSAFNFEVDYSISLEDLAHVMWVLRTGLYTRKPLAVLREYSTNAWDAHQESGITKPIEVHIPTYANPTCTIRDFGPGLDQNGMQIFAKFGASTKRGAKLNCPECTLDIKCPSCIEANERARKAVGALGIGSKAGFCIGDTFTVTSWHNGTKSIYRAAIGPDNKGKLTLMFEQPCSNETGIEIKVPVAQNLILEFEREARNLFPHMKPQPKINIALSPAPEGLEYGHIQTNNTTWIGVMGCIPYRIDPQQIKEELRTAGMLETFSRLGGILYLPLGKVEFAANREELQYTENTKAALVTQFQLLLQEYIDDATTTLSSETGTITSWERRSKAFFMTRGINLKLPPALNEWTREKVPLFKRTTGPIPINFTLFDQHKSPTYLVPVNSNTRILIQSPSEQRKLNGRFFHSSDVVVVPKKHATAEQVRSDLEYFLKEATLDGVPIGDVQERAWVSAGPIQRTQKQYPNSRHRIFQMREHLNTATLSERWAPVDSITIPDRHPFFILNAYKFDSSDLFYSVVNQDRAAAKMFSLEFPAIYGYKNTNKRPITDVPNGTPYMTWRRQFFMPLFRSLHIRREIRTLEWKQLFLPLRRSEELSELATRLSMQLGESHSVTRYFAQPQEARSVVIPFLRQEVLNHLTTMFTKRPYNVPERTRKNILQKYPMLKIGIGGDNDMYCRFRAYIETIVAYIHSIDQKEQQK